MRPARLSETCSDQAVLWLWPGQALYVGPSLELDFHSSAVSCLAVGVDAEFTLELEHGSRRAVRTALVPARVRHRVVADGTRMAFCYLDPASTRERACRRMMTGDAGLARDHEHEAELVRLAASLADGAPPAQVRYWLDLVGPDGTGGSRDPRVRRAAARLDGPRGQRLSAKELALEAGLSVSAFLRLFRAETGTTFRRYRLWARTLRVAALLETWPDLSTAAVEAGFASPSHFSSAFHAMFGLRPSTLFSQPVLISTVGRSAEPLPAPARGAAGARPRSR
ncbi:helix-turn-helix transcriptional regulator [Streptomyces somaliensis DSM 40738]|uniref:Helix-turn-helix transcriptional regulator n=1 Tax=Streptomyces somaliensis (strain ATCC 33201 / DSM 40738 / JCM 12659 / KCTC 9044 / NCTC 11332 / NRRL B-12077 / IP 733) TaxID=1134445 RepID=A0AA44IC71_STRE0|nr:helix-turn-helix transcriptional regulator [Streptomyces somaliensis DSM 40738]